MSSLRDLFVRDFTRDRVDPVVKVDDDQQLVVDIREFVLTDEVSREMLKLVRAIGDQVTQLARGGRPSAVVDGCWLSGFFGAGKSHLAKLVAALIRNPVINHQGSNINAMELFFQSHPPRSAVERDLKAVTEELVRKTDTHVITFEITAALGGDTGSVPEIFLRKFFEHSGFSLSIWLARLERDLVDRGLYERFQEAVATAGFGDWRQIRRELYRVPALLRQVLPHVDPSSFRNEDDVDAGIEEQKTLDSASAESLVDELRRFIGKRAAEVQGKVPLVLFVVDEVGQFVADNADRIEAVRSIAERAAVAGEGRIWFVMTSQEDLEGTIGGIIRADQMSKLNARFGVKIDLKSQNVAKVVRDRLLTKRPDAATRLRDEYRSRWQGPVSELENLGFLGVQYPTSTEETFVASYPLLPYQVQLAQDILSRKRGARLSGAERSMIQIVQDSIAERTDRPVGTLISFDAVFDVNMSELASTHHLGTHGVQEIQRSDEMLGWAPGADFAQPSRVLKCLYLIQLLEEKGWIPQTPPVIAKLLARSIDEALHALTTRVTASLEKLNEASLVSTDGRAFRFLSPEEREIETFYREELDKARRRTPILLRDLKDRGRVLLAANKVSDGTQQYQVRYGGAGHGLFTLRVQLDGEVLSPPGIGDIEVELVSALATEDIGELRTANLAAGVGGKTIWWVASRHDAASLRDALAAVRALKATVDHYQPKADRDEIAAAAKEAVRKKSTDLQRAQKHLDELIETSFRTGTVLFSGEEAALVKPDGSPHREANTLKKVLPFACRTVIPNLYDRFQIADKQYNDAESVFRAVFNPAGNLATLDGIRDLAIVDAGGHVKTQAPLVSETLDALTALEARQPIVKSADLRQELQKAPYGWPQGVVQLVSAVCFRAGLIEVTVAGTPCYDYRQVENAAGQFYRIRSFDAMEVRRVSTVLTPTQINEAYVFTKNTLERAGVRESVNDIFLQVGEYRAELEGLRTILANYIAQGLPLPNPVQAHETLLAQARQTTNPQQFVLSLLDKKDEWAALHQEAKAAREFAETNALALRRSLSLLERARASQTLREGPAADEVGEAVAQLEHLVDQRRVVSSWGQFQTYRATVENAYRTAYDAARTRLQEAIDALSDTVEARQDCQSLDAEQRESTERAWFGPTGRLRAGVSQQPIGTLQELLAADQATSLDALVARVQAVPGQLAHIVGDVQRMLAPPTPTPKPGEPTPPPAVKVRAWSPTALRPGTTIRKQDVDRVVGEVKKELKEQFEGGVEEVVIE